MKRVVTGSIKHIDESPWAAGRISFELTPGSYTIEGTYPRDTQYVTTDANGDFTIELWTNAAGLTPCRYLCVLPSGEKFYFVLPTGTTPISIGSIRVSTEPVSGEQQVSLGQIIDARIASHNTDPASHPTLVAHTINTSNPHNTTAAQVGAYTASQVDAALAAGLTGKADTTDPRFTDQRVPTDGSVTNAKVASNAAISWTKINKSGALPADIGAIDNATLIAGLAGKADTTDPRFTDQRIPVDGSATDAKLGSRTIDQTLATPANTGTLTSLLSWIAGRLRAITGATNWFDAPATTLATTATHLANTSNPHATTAAQVGAYTISQVDSALSTKANTSDARFTDQRTPTDGSVTNAKVAADAAIDWTKISKSGAIAADVGAQSLNTRLSAISNATNPGSIQNIQLNTDGTIRFAVPEVLAVDWANPGAIGSVTPNILKGTTLALTGTANSFDSAPGTSGALQTAGGISAAGNIVAGGYLSGRGDLHIDAATASAASPRIIGFLNSGSTGAAFQFGDSANRLYAGNNSNMTLTSWVGIDLYGSRHSTGATTPANNFSLEYNTAIWDLGGGIVNLRLQPRSGVAKTANFFEVRNAAGALLTSIDSNGGVSAPSLNLTTSLAIEDGGTGADTAAGARTNLGAQAANARLSTISNQANPASIKLFQLNTDGSVTFVDPPTGGGGGGSGTVTSVGLSLPSIFTVTNPTVTTSGTLTATLSSQTQGLVLASPAGASGTPSFRALAWSDVSALAGTSATSFAAGNDARLTDQRVPTDGSVTDAKIGNRTIDQNLATPANTGTITSLLSWIAGRLKAITGATNWFDAPATTLATTATHIASTSNPHSTTAAQVGAYTTAQTDSALALKVNTSDTRLTDQRVPTDGSVTNVKVATNAAIDWTKINKTGAVAADVGAQAANARLGSISDFANPPSIKILQFNTDGSVSLVDPPTGGGGGSVDWTSPGAIGSTTPNTGAFTALRAATSFSMPATGVDVPLGTYDRSGERGFTMPLLKITQGRFDFEPLDNKAEFRVAGSTTQFNIYNTDQTQFYFQINADRTSQLFNTLTVPSISLTTALSIEDGGTGETTAVGALTALGAQAANARLDAISTAPNPASPKLFQLNTDGTIATVDPSAGGGGSVDWTNPGTIGSATPNTGKFTALRTSGAIGFPATSVSPAVVFETGNTPIFAVIPYGNNVDYYNKFLRFASLQPSGEIFESAFEINGLGEVKFLSATSFEKTPILPRLSGGITDPFYYTRGLAFAGSSDANAYLSYALAGSNYRLPAIDITTETLSMPYGTTSTSKATGAIVIPGSGGIGVGGTINANALSLSNALSIDSGGTGSSTASGALANLGAQASNSRLNTIASAANPASIKNLQLGTDGTITLADPATGTVTSVALSLPSIFTVSGSPVTNSGTLSASLNSQAQNLVLASPTGSGGTPAFRSLVWSDVSSLAGTSATSFAAGNDSRLSDARNPIAASVTDSSVSGSAAISWTKISKSGAVASDVGAQASSTRLSTISSRANPSIAEELRLNTDGTIGFVSTTSPRDVYGHRPQVAVSANKTISAADLDTLQVVSAAAAITIPTDANGGASFTGSVEIEIFVNTTGAVTLVGATGVTFSYRNAAGTPTTGSAITVTAAGQFVFLFAKRIGANSWAITGGTT